MNVGRFTVVKPKKVMTLDALGIKVPVFEAAYIGDLEDEGDFTLGLYSAITNAIYYVRGLASDYRREIIVHEYAHALQHLLGLSQDEHDTSMSARMMCSLLKNAKLIEGGKL